ncbi:unnamed protein product [Linum trigynum]|uniref:Uncharacterized protein n=1 Tax=Linum trigynum TaxID=586398 RepID=A0AAV2E2R7_9ROSI
MTPQQVPVRQRCRFIGLAVVVGAVVVLFLGAAVELEKHEKVNLAALELGVGGHYDDLGDNDADARRRWRSRSKVS